MKLRYNDHQHAYFIDGRRARSVTSVAKIPDDTHSLDKWRRRMVAIGLASEPALIQQVAAHVADKDRLDAICEKALEAARAHVAAEAGTTAHRFTEVLDTSSPFIETDLARQIQETWTRVLDEGGFEVVDGMVERIAVHPDLLVAGTFDRILRRKADGRLFIADLKTGAKAISYPHSITVQLAVYANAPLLAGPLSAKGETTEFEPFPDVDKEIGIVIHMPEPDKAELVEFDIAAGWECFTGVIVPTLAWRKRSDLARKIVAVEPSLPPEAPAAQGAGEGDTPAPTQRRQWVIDRVKALGEEGRKVLAAQWPDGVPTLKAFDSHTAEQLALIEEALDRAEAAVEAPFPPPAPKEGNEEATRLKVTEAKPTVRSAPFDEGPDVDPADVKALAEMLDADPEVKAKVEAWAFAANTDGKQSLSLRQKPSLWRWSVVRALIHAARAGCDDDGLRELAYGATGNENCLKLGVPLGAVIAGLWIDEADRLAHLARHLGTDDLTLEFSADGKPIFSGPAYEPPSAA